MFLSYSIFVQRVPDTCRYSQDCMAKKNTPVNSWHIAFFQRCKGHCLKLFDDGSSQSNLLSSSLGSGRFVMRKVCATQSMVARHDSDLMQLAL